MKKYLGIFAAMLLCALLAVSAFAAETVVYVNDGGTGDGSSASAPLGNMTEAISKIANGGKVVIVDTYTCADEFHEPAHKGNITISGGKYIFTNGKYNRWFLEGTGSTTFENITFEYGEGSTSLFVAQFFPLTFGEGVVTPEKGVYVLGGYQYAENVPLYDAPKYDADSHITIKSGTYHAVSGFSRGASTEEYTGTSHITVDGGTIATLYGAAINGGYAANSEIIVNGGTVNNLRTAGDQTRRLNGNSTVTVNGGMIGLLSVNNVMGHTTVNYNGGSIAMAEKTVEAAIEEFVTDGTATLVASPKVDTKLLSIFFDDVQVSGGNTPATTTAPAKTTEPAKTSAPAKTTEPAKTSEPAVVTEDTKDVVATDESTASESASEDASTEPEKTEPEKTAEPEKTTDTEKAADSSASETSAATPASEGGANVGLIVGIVIAVIVVIAVVVVVIKKKK